MSVRDAEEDWTLIKEFVYTAISTILSQRIVWKDSEPRNKEKECYFHLSVEEITRVNKQIEKLIADRTHHNIYLYLYSKNDDEEGDDEEGEEDENNTRGDASGTGIQVIERWHIRYSENGTERRDSVRSNTHKKASVVLRTLHSHLKYLPAYKLYRHNKKMRNAAKDMHFKLMATTDQLLENCQHYAKMKDMSLTAIESSVSNIKCSCRFNEYVTIPKSRTLFNSNIIQSNYLDEADDETNTQRKQQAMRPIAGGRPRTYSMPAQFIPQRGSVPPQQHSNVHGQQAQKQPQGTWRGSPTNPYMIMQGQQAKQHMDKRTPSSTTSNSPSMTAGTTTTQYSSSLPAPNQFIPSTTGSNSNNPYMSGGARTNNPYHMLAQQQNPYVQQANAAAASRGSGQQAPRSSPYPSVHMPAGQKPKSWSNNPYVQSPPLSHTFGMSVDSNTSELSTFSATPPITFNNSGSGRQLPPKSRTGAFDSPTMNVLASTSQNSTYYSNSAPRPHSFEPMAFDTSSHPSSVTPGSFISIPSDGPPSKQPPQQQAPHDDYSERASSKRRPLSVSVVANEGTFRPRIMPSTPLAGDRSSSHTDDLMGPLDHLAIGDDTGSFLPFGDEADDDGVDALFGAITDAKRSHRSHNIYGEGQQPLDITLDSTLASLRSLHAKYRREIAPSFDSLS